MVCSGTNARFVLKAATLSFCFLALTLFASEYVGPAVKADNNYHALAPATPLIQDWTSAALITTDDDWSGVPSINGYRGDSLTGSTGTDPQTILADGSGTPLDVNANEVSTGLTTGGIAEFDSLTDPVVAFQGSGTADAPHLDIRIDSTGCPAPNNIRVGYRLRDIDTAGDTNQQVALHYRVGTTGAYINVPSAYVSDATNSAATLEMNVAAVLPPATLGQSNVHIRIMTTNAAGSDEFVGVDDIAISCVRTTAALGLLGGRVLDQAGQGVKHVSLMVTGGNLTEPVYATSNQFGYYRFRGLDVGQDYVIQAMSGRHTFMSSSQFVSLDEDRLDVNFVTGNGGSSNDEKITKDQKRRRF